MTRPPIRGDDDWDEEERGPLQAPPRPAHARADDDWYDEGEYEELRPEAPRGRRILILLAGIVVVLAVLAFVVLSIVRSRLDSPGSPGEEVRITVPTGSTNADIARLLKDEGVIPDAWFFEQYLRWKGAEGFQAGDYIFRESSAAWDALEVLEQEPLPPQTTTFTVPPGLTVAQVPAQIVDDLVTFDSARIEELLRTNAIPYPSTVPVPAPNYEGLLFPDTYQVGEGMDEAAVLGLMTAHFDRVATEIGLVEGAAALGRTPYEIVIIASLIEEEYGIPGEMGRIARVIYNRLEIGEPLGIDATSRYEAELAGRDRNDIDLESDSPYNTRRFAGLPPTPIAAPSRAALEAALHPEPGPWIYYVRDPDPARTEPGGHFFTDSAREFEAVKAECEQAGLGCG